MNLCLKLNIKCNCDCSTCVYNGCSTLEPFNYNKLKLLDKIFIENDITSINIFGGELGILDKDELLSILKYIENLNKNNVEINLETNGLLLENHLDICQNYNIIFYIIKHYMFKIYNISSIKYYYIVYNIRSIKELLNLANNNKNIIFELVITKFDQFLLNDDFCKEVLRLIHNLPSNIILFKDIYKEYKTIRQLQIFNKISFLRKNDIDIYI